MKPVYVLGCDLSLNHSGFVLVNARTLRPERALFVTTKAGAVKAAEEADKKDVLGIRLPSKFQHSDKNGENYQRLLWWFYLLERMRTDPDWKSRYVAIEDYAMHARSGSVYQIAELGGLVRIAFRGRRLRYHEPMTVKIYATGTGNAEPSETEMSVRKRWKVDYRAFNGTRSGQRPSEDLATAYALARIAAVEWQLRKGKLDFSSLEECEIRVFNRVTKSNPVNILARDWIEDPFHKVEAVWPVREQ